MKIQMARPGTRARFAKLAAVSIAAILATGVASQAPASARPAHAPTYKQVGTYNPSATLTPAQAHQWRHMTDTPAKREAVMKDLASSYQAAGATVTTKDPAGSRPGMSPDFSWGVSSDHVWIILSYQDIARGAISTAVSVCKTRVPGFICTAMGAALSGLANGWGSGASHGVWAAAYWSYPHVTYGRW